MTWVLTFPQSGDVYAADSATGVLRLLRKDQWSPESRRRLKRALAWRAWVATWTPIDEDAEDDVFLRAFAETGLAKLEVIEDGD